MEIFYDLLKLSAVGIISGLFSAYLANKKHRNQKWWELKVSAYQQLIEALSDLIYYYDLNYDDALENREHSEEYNKKLRKFWDQGYHKVRKSAEIGSFLFSKEVNNALIEFKEESKKRPDTYFEYLDNNLFMAKKCIGIITEAAKYDLKI